MGKISSFSDEQIEAEGNKMFPPGARPSAWIGKLNENHQNYIEKYGPGSPHQGGTFYSYEYDPYEYCPDNDRAGLWNARDQYWIMQWQYDQVRAKLQSAIRTVASTTAMKDPEPQAAQASVAAADVGVQSVSCTPPSSPAPAPETSEQREMAAGARSAAPQKSKPEKELFTRKEAANYLTDLGYPITSKTLANRASEKKGPEIKRVGGRPLYERFVLDDWLKTEAAPPDSQIK